MKLLSLTIFFLVLQTGNLSIESLVSCLMPTKGITVTTLNGQFAYYESNTKSGVYKSIYTGVDEIKIRYLHYSGGIDSLVINGDHIAVSEKYDALTIKSYKIKFAEKEYLCLLGNSVSASGSGSQVVYYSLLEMSNGKLKNVVFLKSRFGLIGNIGDLNSDGKLDFLKISNAGQLSDEGREIFKGEACTIDGKPIINNQIKLVYLGNNNFNVVESKWSFRINCR